ncbi:MAG: HEPN domain-containing protein [Candidatus Wallbacteria bacterium]
MEKEEIIKYWKDTSENDFRTMKNLFATNDFCWSLFVGHLVIEKLLKAIYVKNIDENVPKMHNLLRLAEKAGIILNEQQKDSLDIVTTFNISARYPDYKQNFYKKCTEKYTLENIETIKELRLWLLKLI